MRCGHWRAMRSRMSSLSTSVESDFSIFARMNSRSGPESLRPRNIGSADTETLLWRSTRVITLAHDQLSPDLSRHSPHACVSSKAKQYRSLRRSTCPRASAAGWQARGSTRWWRNGLDQASSHKPDRSAHRPQAKTEGRLIKGGLVRSLAGCHMIVLRLQSVTLSERAS